VQAPSVIGVFGRDREMALLRSALSDAAGGQGRLVLISGEPGIGKTTLAVALADEARPQGLRVSTARASETAGAPPYWLWTETLRSDLAAAGRTALSQLRMPARRVLARIVPELRTPRGERPASPSEESEAERFRLADEIASFLLDRTFGGRRLVILDDLHAADTSSLDVLAHLASKMDAGALLILATHRDVADEVTPALQSFLARVSREESTVRIPLAGLDVTAVQSQLTAIIGREVGAELAARVHLRTGGNPFFTAELGRLLAQDATTHPFKPEAVPPGVRDVILSRLSQLPGDARDALDTAALIGQEVPIDVLAAACRQAPESVLAAIEPAVSAALLRETSSPGRVRFAHALVADTIAGALSLRRAAALHERVATAIESRRATSLDEWLPALARHWSAATPSEHAARRTVQMARLAAEQAEGRLAFGDAVPLWRTALDAADQAGSDMAVRGELQLGLARSLFRSGDVAEAVDACIAAARDAATAGRADLEAAAALVLDGVAEPQWARPIVGLAERALARLGDDELSLRARLHAQVGQLIHLIPAAAPGRERTETACAVELAERSNDLYALQAALRAHQLVISGPSGVGQRLQNAARMVQIGKASGDAWPELWGRLWSFDALMQLGRLAEAELELQELEPVVARMGWPVASWHLLRARAAVFQGRGRFGEAQRAADEALAQISGAGLERAEGTHTMFLECQADLVGDTPGGAERLRRLRELVAKEPTVTVRLVMSLGREGLIDEARALYARLPPVERWHPPPYLLTVHLSQRLVAAIELKLRDDVAQLLARFEPFARWHVVFGSGTVVTFGSGFLHTGMAAALLGDLDRAAADMSKAVEDNTRSGAAAMSIVARQELAEALERRQAGTDLDNARRLASTVAQEAQRLGMRPFVSCAAALLSGMPRRRARSQQLTPRELEVAQLIAEGLTNRQLAVRLGISERTAENHLDHIFTKLGFSSRAQVAAWVASGKG
jgi:DNA-binding CsgD family transcriptional regulator